MTKSSARGHYDALIAAAAVAAILYVPYWVPQAPTASDSYTFGYNNRAGVLLLVIFAVGIAVWKKGRIFGPPAAAGESKAISARVLAAALAIVTLACGGVALLVGGLGGIAESNYELDRLDLLARGVHPYTGFEWPFGPALLYGPLWVSRLLRVSLVDGYDLFWLACSLAGVALLYVTINELEYPTEHKTTIFAMLFLAFLPSALELGTHYTLLRYAPPLWCILRVYRSGVRGQGGRAAAEAVVYGAALSALSGHGDCARVRVLRAVVPAALGREPGSAEVGHVCGDGCMPVRAVRRGDAAASAGHAARLGRRRGQPADPAVIADAELLRRGLCLRVRGGAADAGAERGRQHAGAGGDLDSVAGGGAGAVRSGAHAEQWAGNPDCGAGVRVGFGGDVARGAQCVCGGDAGGAELRGGVVYRAAGGARGERPTLAVESEPGKTGVRAAFARVAVKLWPASEIEARRQAMPPERIDFQALYPGVAPELLGVLEAPFGYRPGHWTTYHSSAVDYGYYEGPENANTPQAVERKITELAAHPERAVLLPEDSGELCDAHARLDRAVITVYFAFPYTARVSHPVSVRQPLCGYIVSHYARAQPATAEDFHYELWVPAGR